MNEAYVLDEKKLEAEYEDVLFRLAMLRLERDSTEKLLTEIANGESEMTSAMLDDMSIRSSSYILSNMRRELRREHMRRFTKHTLPKAGRIAAVVMLMFCMGFGAALAAVPSVRIYFYELMTNPTKEYTSVQLIPSETSYADIPAEWQGDYYMTEIPDGYEVYSIYSIPNSSDVAYMDKEERIITFMEDAIHGTQNIDTENAVVSYADIHGSKAIVSEKNNRTIIVWNEFDKVFTLITDGDKTFALEIARNVKRIK